MFDWVLESREDLSAPAPARGTCQAPLFQPLLSPKDSINTTSWAWLVLCPGCQRHNHTLTAYSAFGSSCVLLPFPRSALHCNSLVFWPSSCFALQFGTTVSSVLSFSLASDPSSCLDACLVYLYFYIAWLWLALLLLLIGLYTHL